jgi:hypothetical protein
MNEERRSLDEQGDEERASRALADYTDALLEGHLDPAVEPPPLAEQVALLARTLRPELPPERLRRRVKHAVRTAWGRDRDPSLLLMERMRDLLRARRSRWIWATVTVLLAVALAGVLLMGTELPGITGTAADDRGSLFLVGVLGLAGVLVLIWWFLRRRL